MEEDAPCNELHVLGASRLYLYFIIMASAAPTFTKIGKVIRLNRHGCTNRPFYHIVVQKVKIPTIPLIPDVTHLTCNEIARKE